MNVSRSVRAVVRHLPIPMRQIGYYAQVQVALRVVTCSHGDSILLDANGTIRSLIDSQKSLVRFGDGEISIMSGRGIRFQKFDRRLASQLEEIAYEGLIADDILVALPWTLAFADHAYLKRQEKWRTWALSRQYLSQLLRQSTVDTVIGDAFVYRPEGGLTWAAMKESWSGAAPILVTGSATATGESQRIRGCGMRVVRIPSSNAFSRIDEIVEQVIRAAEEVRLLGAKPVALLSAGPSAKVIAWTLQRKCGVRSIDVGHMFDMLP